MKNKISWFWVFITAVIVWASFGAIPYGLELAGVIDVEEVKRVAPFGGMFGAAEAFFSGFALIAVIISIQQQRESLEMQAEELKLATKEMKASADAQGEMAVHQKNAISLEVIMPFMSEISSEDMREAIGTLASLGRQGNQFAERYAQLRSKKDEGSLDQSEKDEFEQIDRSRRRFIGLFHKMERLSKTGVVGDDIAKVVIGPDHCDLLFQVVEPLEEKIRKNYSRDVFNFASRLYDDRQLETLGRHHR